MNYFSVSRFLVGVVVVVVVVVLQRVFTLSTQQDSVDVNAKASDDAEIWSVCSMRV